MLASWIITLMLMSTAHQCTVITFLLNTSSQNSLQINFIKSSGSVEAANLWLATIFSQYLIKNITRVNIDD